MGLFLWLLLWGGYATGDWVLRDPNFPTSGLNLIHGVRALFPLLAGWLGILVILTRTTLRLSVLGGPLGLMVLFTIVGMISSVFVSLDPIGALYWAGAFGSVVAVSFAVMASEDPLESLSWVHYFNVIVCAAFVLSVMGSIPYLRDMAGRPIGGGAFQLRQGRFVTQSVLGMYGTRNTGLARYAAVLGLAALARLWGGKKDIWRKSVCLVLLLISLYTLYKAQGRTEIAGFIVGAWVILWSHHARRAILVLAAIISAPVLYVVGLHSTFWQYYTLGRGFDPSFSGRLVTWQQGWELIMQSPWIGLGFQADRIFLEGQHMSNGLLHALVQGGFLGTIAWVAALVMVWILVFRLLHGRAAAGSVPLPADVPGILAFLTVGSFAESNFAYFSAAWLIGAPLLGIVECVARRRRVLYSPAKAARQTRPRFAQPEMATRNSGKA